MQQCPPQEESDPGYFDPLGSTKIYQTCSQENGDNQLWPPKVRSHHLCRHPEDRAMPVFTLTSSAQYSVVLSPIHKNCFVNNNQMNACMLEK